MKPSLIVRIPSPLWLIGLIVVALLVDLPLRSFRPSCSTGRSAPY